MAQQEMSYYDSYNLNYCGSAHSSTSNLIDLDSPPCTTPSLTNCSTAPSIRSFSVASGIDGNGDPYRMGMGFGMGAHGFGGQAGVPTTGTGMGTTQDLAAAVMAALQRGETVDFDDEDYAADVLSLQSVQMLEQAGQQQQQRAGSAAGHSRRGATSPSPSTKVWMTKSSKRSGRFSLRIARFFRELRRWIQQVLHCSSASNTRTNY